MKTSKIVLVSVLSMAMYSLQMAVAQEVDRSRNHEQAASNSSALTETLAKVDYFFMEALQATDEFARRRALGSAQAALDAIELGSSAVPGAIATTEDSMEWLEQTDRSLGQFQVQTRKELRESLMHKLWTSPYGPIPINDLNLLETISDALRLLREIRRLGGGNTEALDELQSTYWNRLITYRQATGLEYTTLGDMDTTQVFDQRVLQDTNGMVQIYQLTGSQDRLINWVQVKRKDLPAGLLSSEALTIDLSRESATWLLIIDGDGTTEHTMEHRLWLDAIEREVRLVLLERGDYSVTLRMLPPEWFATNRRIPYVLPTGPNSTPPQLHLVHVTDKKILASWPLHNLGGPGGTALKGLINRIITAANPR